MKKKENILNSTSSSVSKETSQEILSLMNGRVERIVSKGHSSPENFWYDQQENEWVLVFKGAGELEFEDGEIVQLGVGDYVNIPAHKKHRVSWTDPEEETVWLAIFYT